MKKLAIFLTATAAFVCASCTTGTTDKGMNMASAGQYTTDINFNASKDVLKQAVVAAFASRGWSVEKSGDAVLAKIDHRGLKGNIKATFDDGVIHFNSEGTTLNGQPIVPLRYIDFLKSSINRELAKSVK